MDAKKIKRILLDTRSGKLSTEKAYSQLKNLPFEDIGCAKIDHHRSIRTGMPEVIFCKGKSVEQLQKIFTHIKKNDKSVLATKADKKTFAAIKKVMPSAVFHNIAEIITSGKPKTARKKHKISIITAGTADIPVAEEAAVTAEFLGNKVERIFDVGVAGIHRLFGSINKISSSSVIIVIAGMEGALASVVAGLVECPVIAVPTSIGYGASFEGLAALLSMLNCCAPGVAVVNIDNGFGAACMANAIIKLAEKK